MKKYQNSVFYIGDYETEFSERRKKSWREGVFFFGGICIWSSILMPFFLLSVENYCYITEEKICLNKYFSLQEEDYYFEEIQQLTIEKKCDKNGEIYGIACYIENKKGKRIDILNSDFGEEMRKRIFESIEMDNCEIVDNAGLSEEDIKKLFENNSGEVDIYE